MILHAPYLAFLALALGWNLAAARGGFERWAVLPLQIALSALLVRDRWVADAAPWLLQPYVGLLFPLIFGLALVQNAIVWGRRGAPRLSELPLVAFNLIVGACVLAVSLAATGVSLGRPGDVLLADYAVLQDLLGHRLAHEWTVCWHLPLLVRRQPPRTLLSAFGGLFPAALAAFAVILLVALWRPNATVIDSFDAEPRPLAAPSRPLGVWRRADLATASEPPGSLRAWVLPADHDGAALPEVDGAQLVLALRAPAAWYHAAPSSAERSAVFLDGAVRLAARLQPRLILPFPEPDGEGTAYFGPEVGPDGWVAWMRRARTEIRAAAPDTRVGLRLAGLERPSRRLFEALAQAGDAVDVLGPRLAVGGPGRRAAGFASEALDEWARWRSGVSAPPELWILAAGLSPLAFGERGQERFLMGVIARAEARDDVAAVLLDGWRDRDRTRGLIRADGSERAAGVALRELLSSRGDRAER